VRYAIKADDRIPLERITASFIRIRGTPGVFGDRQISRRQCRVPGPMSLAHMDGEHGMFLYKCFKVSGPSKPPLAELIRFKMAIHRIIDGYSRYVLGIKVNNNNRASESTALHFMDYQVGCVETTE